MFFEYLNWLYSMSLVDPRLLGIRVALCVGGAAAESLQVSGTPGTFIQFVGCASSDMGASLGRIFGHNVAC